MSATTARLIKELGSWLTAGAMLVLTVVYFDDIRGLMRSALQNADQTPTQLTSHTQPQEQKSFGGTVELNSDRMGHFQTTAYINGSPVDVMVDTGASVVSMSYEVAQRAGISVSKSDFTARTQTANGIARIAIVDIDDISIGGITIRNVRGAVAEPGRLSKTLLGMTFLSRLSRFEIRSGILVMED
ncbi:MAG: retropepsin-like aspartic protease family protein [Hyphomicrobiaceae bacterium]